APGRVTLVQIDYRFEEVQWLRFEVFDADDAFTSADARRLDLRRQDFQGAAEAAVALIVGARGQTWISPLASPHSDQQAVIKVVAEEIAGVNTTVSLQLVAHGLEPPGGKRPSKCNPFFRLERVAEDGRTVPCFRSEVQMGTTQPSWKVADVPLAVLSAGDPHRPLQLSVFSWSSSGDHGLIGSCRASVNELGVWCGRLAVCNHGICATIRATEPSSAPLYQNSGILWPERCSTRVDPSFFDYVAGGMQINFAIAVDYTASNAPPANPNSLHYVDPSGRLNQYAQAITGVGEVLEFYDSDKRFPLYGFGGKPYPNTPALHCFAVNGREDDPEVTGIAGVLETYYRSLHTVTLSGPTLFAPIISQVATVAASTVTNDPQQQRYWILLIITDGLINDMDATVDAVVAIAALPFSIIIVGVGNEDFSNMEVLDGDEVRLRDGRGQAAPRDIVQFVPMRDYLGSGPEALAKAVLAEVPKQVIEYMQQKRILPGASKIVPRGGSLRDVLQDRQTSFQRSMRSANHPPPGPPGGYGGMGSGGGGATAPPPPYSMH
ncbi:unnamed protein product, partial [Phaeothamnion confervicola]